jgi:hypothetical protein
VIRLLGLVLGVILLYALAGAAIGTLGWFLGGSAVVAALLWLAFTRQSKEPRSPDRLDTDDWQPRPRTRDPHGH